MEKKDIEKILKDAGWKRTVSAPSEVIDYQRFPSDFKERVEYNRLILYSEHVKRLNEVILRKLMETNIPEHSEVWDKMWEEVEKKGEMKDVEKTGKQMFCFASEVDTKLAFGLFEDLVTKDIEVRSAVNWNGNVSGVVGERGVKGGYRVAMGCADKEIAWMLQQFLDWHFKKKMKFTSVKMKEGCVEVEYEKLEEIVMKKKVKGYIWKKTDGWTKEEKA